MQKIEAVLPPLIILHNGILRLLPHFFIAPCVLANPRSTELESPSILTSQQLFRQVHRPAFLQSTIAAIILQLIVNYLLPRAKSRRLTGISLLLAVACSVLARAGLFGFQLSFLDSGWYTQSVSFWLQFAAHSLTIPICQFGALVIVNNPSVSQARWKILSFLSTTALGFCAMLIPGIFAVPTVAIVLSVAPSVFVAAALLLGAPTAATGSEASTHALPTSAGSASVVTAALFIACGGLIGTNGEAILDVYVGMLARKHRRLMVANHAAVLVAMSMAYWLEQHLKTRGGKGKTSKERALMYVWPWAAAQLVRIASIRSISRDSGHLIFGLVMLDKFTGPLGGAALEMALLSLLTNPPCGKPVTDAKGEDGGSNATIKDGDGSARGGGDMY